MNPVVLSGIRLRERKLSVRAMMPDDNFIRCFVHPKVQVRHTTMAKLYLRLLAQGQDAFCVLGTGALPPCASDEVRAVVSARLGSRDRTTTLFLLTDAALWSFSDVAELSRYTRRADLRICLGVDPSFARELTRAVPLIFRDLTLHYGWA